MTVIQNKCRPAIDVRSGSGGRIDHEGADPELIRPPGLLHGPSHRVDAFAALQRPAPVGTAVAVPRGPRPCGRLATTCLHAEQRLTASRPARRQALSAGHDSVSGRGEDYFEERAESVIALAWGCHGNGVEGVAINLFGPDILSKLVGASFLPRSEIETARRTDPRLGVWRQLR